MLNKSHDNETAVVVHNMTVVDQNMAVLDSE
jgi:hypothetical protein